MLLITARFSATFEWYCRTVTMATSGTVSPATSDTLVASRTKPKTASKGAPETAKAKKKKKGRNCFFVCKYESRVTSIHAAVWRYVDSGKCRVHDDRGRKARRRHRPTQWNVYLIDCTRYYRNYLGFDHSTVEMSHSAALCSAHVLLHYLQYIGWQWRNFVPYLCQLIFAAIL